MRNAIASVSMPSNLSVNYLYWTFIVNCCEVLHPSETQVVRESIARHYSYAISLLCKIHKYGNQLNYQQSISGTELFQAVNRLICAFNGWFVKLQRIFRDWKDKMINNEISVDDTLALLEHPKYLSAAAACDVMINEDDVRRVLQEFRQIVSCLKDIFFPQIPLQARDVRFVTQHLILKLIVDIFFH